LFAANIILQKLLLAIKNGRKEQQCPIPEKALKPFVLQLLNSNITEFDYSLFEYGPTFDPKFIFNYLLKNCPKISKILCMHHEFYHGDVEIPVLELNVAWPNLRHLCEFVCTDQILRLLKENLPNLE